MDARCVIKFQLNIVLTQSLPQTCELDVDNLGHAVDPFVSQADGEGLVCAFGAFSTSQFRLTRDCLI